MVRHGAAKNGTRTIAVVATLILLIFAAVVGGFGFQMAEAGGNSNGQLIAANGGIGHGVQQVFGWDPVTNEYIAGEISVDKLGYNQINITFPIGEKVTQIWVFTNNNSFNDLGLLTNSTIYNYANVKIVQTAHNAVNLSGVNMYMGHAVNSSVNSSYGDKGVSNFLINETLYSSTVNNLGNAVELPVLQLLASSLSSKAVFSVSLSISGNFNGSSQVSVDLTQYFAHTASYNIFQDSAAIMVVLGLMLMIFVYFGIPRHDEWGQ